MGLGTMKRKLKNTRISIGSKRKEYADLPNLIEIQLKSFEWFLQKEKKLSNGKISKQGLEELFQDIFPIVSHDEKMSLEYVEYVLGNKDIKYDEFEAKQKGQTYSIPLKAIINLKIHDTGEIRQREIYLGEIPKLPFARPSPQAKYH